MFLGTNFDINISKKKLWVFSNKKKCLENYVNLFCSDFNAFFLRYISEDFKENYKKIVGWDGDIFAVLEPVAYLEGGQGRGGPSRFGAAYSAPPFRRWTIRRRTFR